MCGRMGGVVSLLMFGGSGRGARAAGYDIDIAIVGAQPACLSVAGSFLVLQHLLPAGAFCARITIARDIYYTKVLLPPGLHTPSFTPL